MGASAISRQVSKSIQKRKKQGTYISVPPFFKTDALPGATQNAAYNFSVDIDGGSAPFTVTLTDGALPAGLILISQDSLEGKAGTIKGTPTGTSGTTFTLKVKDRENLEGSRQFSLSVSPAINANTAPAFLILNENTLKARFAKTSTATAGTWKTIRDRAILMNAAYLNPAQTVMSKPKAGPSGDKHDHNSGSPYWWPRIHNKVDANGNHYFDASKVSGTAADQRDGGGKWTGSNGEYFGSTGSTVDYSKTGNFPRTLAWDPVKQAYNGEPYINRDPNHNDQNDDDFPDGGNITNTNQNLLKVAKAYYFSQTPTTPKVQAYAKKVRDMIYAYYLNPATRMNPNMDYAQIIQGHYNGLGRAEGMIDGEYIPRMLEAYNLTKDSTHWTFTDVTALKNWIRDYNNWQLVPTRRTNEQIGNIKAAFESQYISGQLFLADHTKAYNRMKTVVWPLLDFQMRTAGGTGDTRPASPLGSFREEWFRPSAWGYSTKVLKIWMELAELCEKIIPPTGQPVLDLWNYVTPSGKSLRMAINYHYEAAKKGGAFGNAGININPKQMVSVMRIASDVYRDAASVAWWPDFLRAYHNQFLSAVETSELTKDAMESAVIRYRYADEPAI